MKFLIFLILAGLLVWRLGMGRWPWQPRGPTMRSGGGPTPEQARLLLGVRTGASREDVIEAHKKLIAMVHPDRGGTSDQVHEANQARDLLLAEAAGRSTEHP